MLNHIGFPEKGKRLELALDICGQLEKKLVITGRKTGATGREFTDYLMETLQDSDLEEKWKSHQR